MWYFREKLALLPWPYNMSARHNQIQGKAHKAQQLCDRVAKHQRRPVSLLLQTLAKSVDLKWTFPAAVGKLGERRCDGRSFARKEMDEAAPHFINHRTRTDTAIKKTAMSDYGTLECGHSPDSSLGDVRGYLDSSVIIGR